MRFFILIVFCLLPKGFSAQEIMSDEKLKALESITVYEKDTTASAVILFEKGEYAFVYVENRLHLRKKIHKKIKILKESGKEYANGSIYIQANNKKEYEWTRGIKASTQNGQEKIYVREGDIFTKHYKGSIYEQTFAFPDVRAGSILELEYYHYSPFFFNLDGWQFQNYIPTIYSELSITFPNHMKYNQVLIGDKKIDHYNLTTNHYSFGYKGSYKVQSKVQTYIMNDIPAFIGEDFMLSEKNYLSRIDFQINQILGRNNKLQVFTKEWKDVDTKFKTDNNIGKQTFFTVGEDEVRAWVTHRGATAQEAAGEIHTDLSRGFVRAEVVAYEDLTSLGSMNEAKAKGKFRLEGKEYIVKDGDIMHVRSSL